MSGAAILFVPYFFLQFPIDKYDFKSLRDAQMKRALAPSRFTFRQEKSTDCVGRNALPTKNKSHWKLF